MMVVDIAAPASFQDAVETTATRAAGDAPAAKPAPAASSSAASASAASASGASSGPRQLAWAGSQGLLRFAAIALVYALLYCGTPVFLTPFGEASPLSLAAGWVFAMAAARGWSAALPLTLGAALAHSLQGSLACLPAIVAAGLQALVVAQMAGRPEHRKELTLLTRAAAMQRLVLPALAASAVAAAGAGIVGSLAAQLAAVLGLPWNPGTAPLPPAQALLAMLARFCSDTGGMLIVGPVALTLIHQPVPHQPTAHPATVSQATPSQAMAHPQIATWYARRWTLGLPLAAATALLLLALLAIARWDLARARDDFAARSRSIATQVEQRLGGALDAVEAVRGAMIPSAGRLTRGEFDALALPWLVRAPGVSALGWHERVPQAERAAFEQGVREQGEPGFRVHDRRDGVSASVLSADPDVLAMRHAISLQSVPVKRSAALGINVLSIPEVRATLLKALAGGPARASPAFRLTQLNQQGTGMALYRPLRGADGQSAGVVYATILIDRLLADALVSQGGLRACLFDEEPDATQRLLAGGSGGAASTATLVPMLEHQEALDFGDRRWRLQISQPLAAAVREGGHWYACFFAVPGIAGVALLALLLLANCVRVERVAQDREKAVEAAAGSERDLQGIFQTVTTGVVQVGPDGSILNANPAFCELTGYSRDELLAMNMQELTPPADLPGDAQIRALFELQRPTVLRVNKHYRTRFGRLVPVLVTVRVMFGNDGRALYTVGAVQDLSESLQLREAERVRDRAEAANRAKGEFVARMSHELRTPLNAILGFTQLLATDSRAPLAAHQRDWLKHAQQAGWHLLAMINDVLDLARVDEGRLPVSLEPVDLAEAVEASVNMVEEAAGRRGIVIERALEPQALGVMADPLRLRQILINLLSNAVKYNRDHGRVRVCSWRTAGGRIEIDVSDTGCGIDANQLDALFQPFNRLGRERSGIEGNGIGLVIARRLAELMGGSLRATSQSGQAGQGACFTLTLAAIDIDARPARASAVLSAEDLQLSGSG